MVVVMRRRRGRVGVVVGVVIHPAGVEVEEETWAEGEEPRGSQTVAGVQP